MLLRHNTSLRTLEVTFAAVLSSCADRVHGDDSAGTTSTGDFPEHKPCSKVHEGTISVEDANDIESLRDIGVIRGGLRISLGEPDQRDLAFLHCLHTVDGNFSIISNEHLESTHGLENLRIVTRLYVLANENLRTAHFPSVEDVEQLDVSFNPMLEELRFDALKTAETIGIGGCYMTTPGGADHLSLVNLSGFGALTSVGSVSIKGNEALVSVGIFDALAANGAPDPLGKAYVQFNSLLPEADVQAQLDALGPDFRRVCGNLDGDPECYCYPSE